MFCQAVGAQCSKAMEYISIALTVVHLTLKGVDTSDSRAKRKESANLIRKAVDTVLKGTWQDIVKQNLRPDQIAKYNDHIDNKRWRAARSYIGFAVHKAVAKEVGRLYGPRFVYRTKGVDFLDTTNGVKVELTTYTSWSFRKHLIKRGDYARAPYVLYRGPGSLPKITDYLPL